MFDNFVDEGGDGGGRKGGIGGLEFFLLGGEIKK